MDLEKKLSTIWRTIIERVPQPFILKVIGGLSFMAV